MWDVETDSERSPAQIVRDTRPGSIIPLHVMNAERKPELAAVPAIVSGLSARGYHFVRISELLAKRWRASCVRWL